MDIVERLRHHKSSDVWTERKDRTWYETDDLCMEAADEIERLRKDYALAWENHLLHEQIFVLTEAKIERLREQAHYHYENGLKKDVEIERLREALRTIRDGSRDVEKSYADLQQEESE